MKNTVLVFGALFATSALLMCVCVNPVAGKAVEDVSKREAARPADDPINPDKALKVYEWGVSTQHWSGGPDTRFDGDVPAAYYSDSEVPIEAEPQPIPVPEPVDPPDRPDTPRKPVVYFDCDDKVTFDLDVVFKSGKVVWMYPKPSRRTSEAVAQWDNIVLTPNTMRERPTTPPPPFLDVPADHWANYSREGATSTLTVNGEREKFLFYEGAQTSPYDLDISKNDKGEFVLRNYSAWPIHDFGAMLKIDGKAAFYRVAEIPAANGDVPGAVVISDKHKFDAKKGMLAAQCEKAGLTAAQGKVFDRCWHDEFMGTMDDRTDHCYWYRRDQAALDALVELKLTLPLTHVADVKRVGYVYVHGVDYEKLAEYDKLVASAVGGDKDAREKLEKGGAAAVGALRRAMADKDQPLKKRLELAQMLKSLTQSK